MGGTTNTSTQTSGVNNADLNNTISALSKGIQSSYTPGQSITTAPGANTTGGESAALSAASNPLYSGAADGALGYFGKIASGANVGADDPAYDAVRSKLLNDVTTATDGQFNNSGLFGSDSNKRALADQITGSVGALDLQHLQDSQAQAASAAGMLPQLFQNTLLPSSVQSSVGAQQDQAAQGQASGPTDYLAKLAGIINGTAGAAGTTTTSSTPGTPLWQILLGGGIGLASAL